MKYGLLIKFTKKSKKMVTQARKFSKKHKNISKRISKASKKVKKQFKRLRYKAKRVWKDIKCKIFRGEPVDAVSGEVVTEYMDFSMQWRIPVEWYRYYGSQSNRKGLCGYNWETPADIRLELEEDGTVAFHDGTGAPVHFDYLPEGKPIFDAVDGSMLQREKDYYIVRVKEGLIYYFPAKKELAREIPVEYVKDLSGNFIQYVRDGNGLKEINESGGRKIAVKSRNGLIENMSLVYPYRDPVLLVRYEYDENSDLIMASDAMEACFRFSYQNHLLTKETKRSGLNFNYEYDKYVPEGKCIHTWGDDGLYDYRLKYLEEERITEITDSLGNVSYLKYDESYMVTEQTDQLGNVTCFEYNYAGRTSAVIDPDGNKTEYVYDNRGNLVKLIRPDGKFIDIEYDSSYKPIRTTDPNGAVWQQEWNSNGLLMRRISPIGAKSEYEYDGKGQLISFTDPLGAVTRFSYDNFGNLAEITDALSNSTKLAYDILGNVVTRTDASGRTTRYEYDLKSRLKKVLLPIGTSISCAYDSEDNLIYFKDKNGAETRIEYCGMGKIKRLMQPDGNMVEYEYDTEENLVAVKNQKGERYELKRDALGRIISETDYWGQERKYAYNPAGHLSESIDPLGRVVKYKTDPLGRILEKLIPDPKKDGELLTEAFEYDANGNLIACENENLRVEWEYDTDGQMLTERQGDECVVSNIYDLNGNRTQRNTKIHINGKTVSRTVNYNYNTLGQVMSVEIQGYDPMQFTRNALGQITDETLSRSLKRRYDYNEDGYIAAQRVLASEGPIFEQRYTYDEAGNLIKKHDSVFGDEKFTYDPIGRITSHINPEGKIRKYLHDAAGNLMAARVVKNEGEWSREGEHEGVSYWFDRAGNLVERKGNKETSFVWDGNQHLIESTTNGHTTSYKYDPLGRRICKDTDGEATRFYWDGNILMGDSRIGALEDSSTRLREFIYYPYTFEPLAMLQTQYQNEAVDVKENLYLYHNDINGCPTRLMELDGKVVWAARYDALGKLESMPVNEVDNPLRLQGAVF